MGAVAVQRKLEDWPTSTQLENAVADVLRLCDVQVVADVIQPCKLIVCEADGDKVGAV